MKRQKKIKIVINRCFGGFSLSAKAIKRLAELQGKECYFFKWQIKPDNYIPLTLEECEKSLFWLAFSIPNPNEYFTKDKDWNKLTLKEKKKHSKRYEKVDLPTHRMDRTNPLLIQVVEELGKEANGSCAELKIVKIPSEVDWEIDEYDGLETIHEKHRSWS
jgi:hypothetical protein